MKTAVIFYGSLKDFSWIEHFSMFKYHWSKLSLERIDYFYSVPSVLETGERISASDFENFNTGINFEIKDYDFEGYSEDNVLDVNVTNADYIVSSADLIPDVDDYDSFVVVDINELENIDNKYYLLGREEFDRLFRE